VFHADGSIDAEGMARVTAFALASGAHGVVFLALPARSMILRPAIGKRSLPWSSGWWRAACQ